MSSGAIVAPGAFGFLIGVASRVGLSSADAVGLGLGDSDAEGDAVGLGSGVGEPFFFFDLGEAEGELFGAGVSEGVAVGDGLVLDELLRFGEAVGVGDSSGFFAEALGFGEADGDVDGLGFGDGVGELLDFFAVKLFRFFGGGVGSKIFLILSPNESSAACAAGAAKMRKVPSRIQRIPFRHRVIPSQRKRRGTSHRVFGALLGTTRPSTLGEVPRPAPPASG